MSLTIEPFPNHGDTTGGGRAVAVENGCLLVITYVPWVSLFFRDLLYAAGP